MSGRGRDIAPAECVRPGMSGGTVPALRNLDVYVKVCNTRCMSARIYPSPAPSEAEVMAARAVLKADRLARMRERRAARRSGTIAAPKFPTAPYLCAYCGTPFEARSLRRAVMGRYCSASCRQLAYKSRCRVAATRESTRTAVLARMEA
jgi:5-methylcytosine-specific restriction endonuclease McrA